MDPKELERERQASLERRRRQLEQARDAQAAQDWTDTRSLTRAQRAKLKDDDYVPPEDA